MLPVYSAGETELDGINSRRLVDDINQLHPKLVTLIDDLSEIEEFKSKDPSLVISLGAGSIGRMIREKVEMLKND